MSDFLTNLVARTIAQPTLRPRTRSRFEPPIAEPSPVWAETSATRKAEPPATSPSPIPSPTRIATTPAMERRHPAGRSAGFQPAVPTPIDATSESVHLSTEENTDVPERVSAETPPARTVVVERTETRDVPRRQVEVQRSLERIVDRVVETRERTITVPETERSENTPPPERILPHRHDEEPPRVSATEPTRIAPPQRERVTRTSVERDRPRRAAHPPETVEKPIDPIEPVIHVSIGRIEVRAVAAAEPQRKTRRPPMSIEEYTARRDAKERR